jgi:hypothetical protein
VLREFRVWRASSPGGRLKWSPGTPGSGSRCGERRPGGRFVDSSRSESDSSRCRLDHDLRLSSRQTFHATVHIRLAWIGKSPPRPLSRQDQLHPEQHLLSEVLGLVPLEASASRKGPQTQTRLRPSKPLSLVAACSILGVAWRVRVHDGSPENQTTASRDGRESPRTPAPRRSGPRMRTPRTSTKRSPPPHATLAPHPPRP